MNKTLISFLLIFGFINPINAEIKGTDLTKKSDAYICSWFEVVNPPQIYINEARKRDLACGIPLNASQSGNSWICHYGYKKNGNKCIKIYAPPNGYVSGNTWLCNTGYRKSGNYCIKKVFIPKNAYASGSSWLCKSGYRKSGNNCIKTKKSQSSSSISLIFFNDNGPTLLFWLALIFFIYLIRLNSNSSPKTKVKPQPIIRKKDKVVIAPIATKKDKVVIPKPKTPPKTFKKEKVVIPKPKTPPKTFKKEKVVMPFPKTPPKTFKKDKVVIPKVNVEKTSLGFNVLHFEQGSKEWLEWRHSGIGASDASTVMGDNRFESPEELLYAKKNKIVESPNEAMKEGTRLEPIARDLYIEKTGIKVIPLCLQDKKDSWIIASMDGITEDFKHIVEIKCGKSAYWQAHKGIVPDYYYGQLQHQMMITGLKEVDYWCYWPDQKPILQNIKRDEIYIKSLYKAEKDFIRKLYE